jgi:hydrogenase nickel incorporation protein HypB
MKIKVMDKVLAANDAWAEENRKFLAQRSITMLNLIGSPGSGKTSLLEKTIDLLGKKLRIGVIEGDIATSRDAERIGKKGIPVFQINTGNACHLDAHLVNAALKELCKSSRLNLIFVENIGNLVCPAEFDIGEHAKIAILSVTEGDDKVEKYPLLFSEAKALIITKLSLLSHTNFKLEKAEKDFRKVNREAPILRIDNISGEGFSGWIAFLNNM